MKRVSLVVAGVLAALMTAMTAGAASSAHAIHNVHIGGLVPPIINGKVASHYAGPRPGVSRAMRTPQPSGSDNLSYNGGRVMINPTFIPIYWNGGGESTYPARYQSIVNRYFLDLGAASGAASNVFAAATQYNDPFDGPITGVLSVGHASVNTPLVDTDPYPDGSAVTYDGDGNPSSSACGSYNPASIIVESLGYCFTDAQLETEIENFLVANPSLKDDSGNTEYVIYTGRNVGSCFPDDLNQPTGQDCAYTEYCAYHGSFFSDVLNQDVVYANMPYPNQPQTDGVHQFSTACATPDEQFPNAGGALGSDPKRWDKRAADQAINVSTHEMNESLTDPDLDAWWVSNFNSPWFGYENGDLCAWYFPNKSLLGGSKAQLKQYNQLINGDHYFVQGEWSNFSATGIGNSGCVWKFTGPPVIIYDPGVFLPEPVDGQPDPTWSVGTTVTAWPGDYTNMQAGTYTYSLLRCAPDSNNDCKVIKTGTLTEAQAQGVGLPYKLTAADDKMTLEFQVVAKNKVGSAPLDISDPTPPIGGEPEGGSPSISVTGSPTPGSLLTTLVGNVDAVLSTSPATNDWGYLPKSYAYQWLKCDLQANCTVALSGTVLQPALALSPHLPMTVTFTPSTWTNVTYEFSVVAANAAGKSDPVITDPVSHTYTVGAPGFTDTTGDNFVTGDKLAADPDGLDWNPAATGFTYKWYQCSSPSDTSTCTTLLDNSAVTEPVGDTPAIDPTGQSYFVSEGDVCDYVAVQVTPMFSQQAGTEPQWSNIQLMGGIC